MASTPRSARLLVVVVASLLLGAAQPLPLGGESYTVQYDAAIARMVASVSQPALYAQEELLSGVKPVVVGGATYVIRTRNTRSGAPIQKATQYVYESLQSLGTLDSVTYASWRLAGLVNRNVIGEVTGTTRPDEVVLLTAHLDSLPNGNVAPGADDNASGTAALMLAAKTLSGHQFERTIRFVFFTGEEQGLLGSRVYARDARRAGENIVAVLNMDMLGWDGEGGPTMRVHTRAGAAGAGDRDIARAFVDAVAVYNVPITPIITSYGMSASDHASFWRRGYDAVCIIEDDGDLRSAGDFNPYYHKASDTLAKLNMPYFTSIVRAVLAAAAHLAVRSVAP